FPCQGENLRRLKLQFEGDPAHCFDLGFDKALSLSEYLGNVIQYKQLVVVHWPPSCRKHATLCRLPTSLRRGASLRQRSMAKGQRGGNLHPGGGSTRDGGAPGALARGELSPTRGRELSSMEV